MVTKLDSVLILTISNLGSIDNYGIDIVNFASDFIAQYTTRQVYRYSEVPPTNGRTGMADKSGLCNQSVYVI
jgi:phosphatidylinositol 4-kinase